MIIAKPAQLKYGNLASSLSNKEQWTTVPTFWLHPARETHNVWKFISFVARGGY